MEPAFFSNTSISSADTRAIHICSFYSFKKSSPNENYIDSFYLSIFKLL
jgi:hypothetical protein